MSERVTTLTHYLDEQYRQLREAIYQMREKGLIEGRRDAWKISKISQKVFDTLAEKNDDTVVFKSNDNKKNREILDRVYELFHVTMDQRAKAVQDSGPWRPVYSGPYNENLGELENPSVLLYRELSLKVPVPDFNFSFIEEHREYSRSETVLRHLKGQQVILKVIKNELKIEPLRLF